MDCSRDYLSLFQPLGLSPSQVTRSLIKKAQDQLSRAKQVQDSIPDTEESIRNIQQLFQALDPTSEERTTIAVDIVHDVCELYVSGIGSSNGLAQEVGVAIAVAELFVSVAECISDDECVSVLDSVLKHASTDGASYSESNSHGLLLAIPFLIVIFNKGQVLSRFCSIRQSNGYDTLSILLSTLKNSSVSTACHISGQLLPALIQASPSPRSLVDIVWDFVCQVWRGHTSVYTSGMDLSLTLLCCLHHVFINPSNGLFSNDSHDNSSLLLIDLRVKELFWEMVQGALIDSDPLSRKRGIFLLHKALSSVSLLSNDDASIVGGASSAGVSEEGVFWWGYVTNEELSDAQAIWEGVVLLLETLEEKQVHIVKPVINKQLSALIKATKQNINGHCVLHISWVGVILSRVYAHDAKTIVKLGISTCLEMDLEHSPLLQRSNWEVIFNPLISVLRNAYIFAREGHCNTDCSPCPVIAQLFTEFIQRFINYLPTPERESFFSYLLNTVSSADIPDIPSVFISYTLSYITLSPPSQYMIGHTSLEAIRTMIKTATSTHSIALRAATQSFLLKCFCDHFDKSLGLGEFFQTLCFFNSRECLVFGSSSWTMATDCLIGIITNNNSENDKPFQFLLSGISQITSAQTNSCSSTHSNIPILSLATLLTLTAATKVTPAEKNKFVSEGKSLNESTSSLLYPVMETITGARTRPYISHTHLVTSVNLLESIVQFVLDSDNLITDHHGSTYTKDVAKLLYSVLLPWLPDTLQFLVDGVMSGTGYSESCQGPSLEHTILYRDCLNCVYCFMDRNGYQWNENRDFDLYSVSEKALKVVVDIQTPTAVLLTPTVLGSITALEWVCGQLQQKHIINTIDFITSMARLPVGIFLTRPPSLPSSKGDVPLVSVEYGPIIDHCLTAYWKCLSYFMKTSSGHVSTPSIDRDTCSLIRIGSAPPEALASACIDYIDIANMDLATPLYFLANLIAKLPIPYVVTTVFTVWPLVKGNLKQLLQSLQAFFAVAFHSYLLLCEDSALLELHTEIMTEVIEMSESKMGLFNLLIGQLTSQWKSLMLDNDFNDDQVIKSIENRKLVLIEGLGFGPIYRKNLRIIDDIEEFLRTLGSRCSSNSITLKQLVTDGSVRVQVLCLLLELKAGKQVQQSPNLLTQQLLSGIVLELISMLKKLSQDRPRYYINSFTHRYRLRLMQVLLALHSCTTLETAKTIIETLWACLERDNQLSVRYCMEWLIVLLYNRYPELWKDTLLSQLSMDGSGRRLSRFCSVFTVAMQYGKCLDSDSDKLAYYSQVLPLLFQWSLCHHFIVRLYAVGSVLAMWNESSQLLQGLPEFALFPNYVNFITSYSDLSKSKKLEMNIFFTHFHPLHDFSIQAIYHILPALSGVLQEEWITLCVFHEQFSSFGVECFVDLPTECTNKVLLSLLKNDNQMVNDEEVTTVQVFDPNEVNNQCNDTDGSTGASGDVQKKITPWSNSREILGELFPGIHPIQRNRSHHKGLVLVASLLSKPPNLGGLCRTCEIFGASEVVLSSRNVIEEKEFKTLSVTAEKWITITEVKPAHLAEYLLHMKTKHYHIVGIEQTAHSESLQSFKFPSTTVLLLGNERQGIPVELIHLLDGCVEIPQLGVIRSLNVHVSGALVIWEYFKQHLIK